MAYNFNTNFGSFVRNKYNYPQDDYLINPEELNFGIEYNINVAAIWIGKSPEQYAYCDLTSDTSLTLSHSSGTLSNFTVNSSNVIVNSSIKINLNAPLVECSTEIKAPLGTFASLSAPYKMFDIPHPTKTGMRLRHACLEGPEISVFIKGKLNIIDSRATINLPSYWRGLVDGESIMVNLTSIGKYQKLYVEKIDFEQLKIFVNSDESESQCFYMVTATRIDIEPLKVEINEYTSRN